VLDAKRLSILARRDPQIPDESASHLLFVTEPAGLGDGRDSIARFFEPAHKRRDDPLYELILNLEHIVRTAIVALSPPIAATLPIFRFLVIDPPDKSKFLFARTEETTIPPDLGRSVRRPP